MPARQAAAIELNLNSGKQNDLTVEQELEVGVLLYA